MKTAKDAEALVGIHISPISFVDEGVEPLLDMLCTRFGINALMVGTFSWLGLKVGRRVSWELDGWPDHGVPELYQLKGGSYLEYRPEYYANTYVSDFRARDPEMEGKDILEMILAPAHARGMKVLPDLMEPLFKYAGHGGAGEIRVRNVPQCLEIDLFGRYATEPCTNHPAYRAWWYSAMEDHCRNYEIDGVMWCNERKSPLENMIAGRPPTCFCTSCREKAAKYGIDVERTRIALERMYEYFQQARGGKEFVDGSLIEFLHVLLKNPEVLIWERFWVEYNNKALDRELYGIVKWCNPSLSFGLNQWNFFRKAQWPWEEQTLYSDWVKPIAYQHQAGLMYVRKMEELHESILRDFSPEEITPVMYKVLGLNEVPWDKLVEKGMDPDTFVYGQCRDAVRGVGGKAKVYMGIGVDAPRTREDQAKCTPDIVYRSVLATYRAGGDGVIFAPAYAGMSLANLDGGARALEELGWK
jgi:hypothetical protein